VLRLVRGRRREAPAIVDPRFTGTLQAALGRRLLPAAIVAGCAPTGTACSEIREWWRLRTFRRYILAVSFGIGLA